MLTSVYLAPVRGEVPPAVLLVKTYNGSDFNLPEAHFGILVPRRDNAVFVDLAWSNDVPRLPGDDFKRYGIADMERLAVKQAALELQRLGPGPRPDYHADKFSKASSWVEVHDWLLIGAYGSQQLNQAQQFARKAPADNDLCKLLDPLCAEQLLTVTPKQLPTRPVASS